MRLRRVTTAYRVWSELVKQLRVEAASLNSAMSSLADLASEAFKVLSEKRLLKPLRLNGSRGVCAAGVDGSRSRLYSFGVKFYAAVSSSLVVYNGDGVDLKVFARNLVVPEYSEPSRAEEEVTLEMFKAELEALREALKRACGCTIFLDGPLVDPPRPLNVGGHGGEEENEYERYVEERVRVLHAFRKCGGTVVGVVKRIYGSLLVRLLEDAGLVAPARLRIGDYGVMLLIASYARKYFCEDGRSYALVVGPLDPSPAKPEARRYGSVQLYYISPRLCGSPREARPVGLEVFEGINIDDVVRVYEAWCPRGSPIPEPVILAHRKCTLRSVSAGKLYRELLSRVLSGAIRGLRVDEALLKIAAGV